jgi:hypothetical protein
MEEIESLKDVAMVAVSSKDENLNEVRSDERELDRDR